MMPPNTHPTMLTRNELAAEIRDLSVPPCECGHPHTQRLVALRREQETREQETRKVRSLNEGAHHLPEHHR